MKAPAPSAGYSGTPLPKKLGLKDGQKSCFIALPQSLDWLRDAAGFAFLASSDEQTDMPNGPFDVIHAFYTEAERLGSDAPRLMAAIQPDGMIWISWPKKASKRPTDITEDVIRSVVLPLGLVDVKVCAVDEVWSGLKLVIRKERRGIGANVDDEARPSHDGPHCLVGSLFAAAKDGISGPRAKAT